MPFTMEDKTFLMLNYDNAARNYAACCDYKHTEAGKVISTLTEKEQKKIIAAAKSGWVSIMTYLDKMFKETGLDENH